MNNACNHYIIAKECKSLSMGDWTEAAEAPRYTTAIFRSHVSFIRAKSMGSPPPFFNLYYARKATQINQTDISHPPKRHH